MVLAILEHAGWLIPLLVVATGFSQIPASAGGGDEQLTV